MPRIIEKIFDGIRSTPEKAWKISVSYLELYNDTLHDLLSHDSNCKVGEDAKGNTFVKGLSQRIVSSEEETLTSFFEGESQKIVISTPTSQKSNRYLFEYCYSNISSLDHILSLQ